MKYRSFAFHFGENISSVESLKYRLLKGATISKPLEISVTLALWYQCLMN
jgi:hypothetical protein